MRQMLYQLQTYSSASAALHAYVVDWASTEATL